VAVAAATGACGIDAGPRPDGLGNTVVGLAGLATDGEPGGLELTELAGLTVAVEFVGLAPTGPAERETAERLVAGMGKDVADTGGVGGKRRFHVAGPAIPSVLKPAAC
jgi:hypothetical protein